MGDLKGCAAITICSSEILRKEVIRLRTFDLAPRDALDYIPDFYDEIVFEPCSGHCEYKPGRDHLACVQWYFRDRATQKKGMFLAALYGYEDLLDYGIDNMFPIKNDDGDDTITPEDSFEFMDGCIEYNLALNGNVTQLKRLVSRYEDVDTSAIAHGAALNGHEECLRFGLTFDNRLRALKAAFTNGHLSCVKILEMYEPRLLPEEVLGAFLNGTLGVITHLCDAGYLIPEKILSYLVGKSDLDVIEFLMSRNCAKDIDAVSMAARSGNFEAMVLCVDYGCPILDVAIEYAVIGGNFKCLEYLVSRGSKMTKSLLVRAAVMGDHVRLRYLFENGCPRDRDGSIYGGRDERVLAEGLVRGHRDVVSVSLEYGCRLTYESRRTIVRDIAFNGCAAGIKMAIELGYPCEEALEYAVQKNNVDCFEACFSAGCSVPKTFIPRLVWRGHLKILQRVLQDKPEIENKTIIMAIKNGKVNELRLIVESGYQIGRHFMAISLDAEYPFTSFVFFHGLGYRPSTRELESASDSFKRHFNIQNVDQCK